MGSARAVPPDKKPAASWSPNLTFSRHLQRKRRNGRFPLRHEVEQNQRSAQKLHRGSGQLRAPDPPFSSGRLGEAVAAGTGSKTQSVVKTGRARPSCSPNSSSQQ